MLGISYGSLQSEKSFEFEPEDVFNIKEEYDTEGDLNYRLQNDTFGS